MDSDLPLLNKDFEISSQVRFEAGPGGLIQAVIENKHAAATMTLMGAHVLTYTPRGHQPVLWTAPHEIYQPGTPFHSGVPVCWPWFAVNKVDPNLPLHGLVRTRMWTVSGTRALADGSSEVRMTIRESPETLALWPYSFELEVIATFGQSLKVEWIVRNTSQQAFQYTGALHPYFTVRSVSAVHVDGLDGSDYLDKTRNFDRFHQSGPVTFTDWTDRIYLETTSDLVISDPGYGREIRIHKWGSQTTVVWNPAEKGSEIQAIGPYGYGTFVCVEAANAVDDVVSVPPGGESRLGMQISAAEVRGRMES